MDVSRFHQTDGEKSKAVSLSKSQLEQIDTELDGYIDLLRTCLYKKG